MSDPKLYPGPISKAVSSPTVALNVYRKILFWNEEIVLKDVLVRLIVFEISKLDESDKTKLVEMFIWPIRLIVLMFAFVVEIVRACKEDVKS